MSAQNQQGPLDARRPEKLTAQARRAAEILATNDIHQMTVEQIAAEVGVTARTIFRWKQDEEFITYQNEIAERAMRDFLSETYTVLKKIVRSGSSEGTKLKAVELVLKNQGRLTEVTRAEVKVEDSRSNEAIEQEIDELRRLLGEIGGNAEDQNDEEED